MVRPRSDIALRIQLAAREQFLLQGVDGASLRAIAAEAGTSIGMVYYYFPSKDDLFFAVVETVYQRLLAEVAEILRPEIPVAEKLQRVYTRLWRLSDDEYAIVRLVLREAMVSADRVRRLGALFAQGHVPLLLGALHAGVEEGALREDVPPVAMVVCTMALGMMPMLSWRVAGQRLMPDLPLPSPEALGALFSRLLLEGLSARAAVGSRKERKAPAKKLRARGRRRAARSRPAT